MSFQIADYFFNPVFHYGSDQQDYFCPINLDYIFSKEGDPIPEKLELEDPTLDGDVELEGEF